MPSANVKISKVASFKIGGVEVTQRLVNLRWTGIRRIMVDVTAQPSTVPSVTKTFGGREYLPAPHADPGQIIARCWFNPDNDLYQANLTQLAFEVVWNAENANWDAVGFVEGTDPIEANLDNAMAMDIICKLTGIPTITSGA